jgi:lipopolysaccharide biosynthesis glycosyltransferase
MVGSLYIKITQYDGDSMMEKEKIHIAACLDKGYVMPTGVMIYSVCANTPDSDIDFHLVVDESVSDNDIKNLIDAISQFEGKRALFYNVTSHVYKNLPLTNSKWLTRATYYRLYLPEILPESVSKVIYIDGDCIVRHSLLPLWSTDISEIAIGTVFNAYEGKIERYNRLRYSPEFGYFNAGVLLINIEYWRKHHIVNSLTEYISNYPERIVFEDQDVMNAVLKESKRSLHPKYNLQSGMLRRTPRFYYWKYEDEIKEAIADPVIIHFASREKPWYVYMCDPHPYKNSFVKYQNQTKWKGIKTEKRSL